MDDLVGFVPAPLRFRLRFIEEDAAVIRNVERLKIKLLNQIQNPPRLRDQELSCETLTLLTNSRTALSFVEE